VDDRLMTVDEAAEAIRPGLHRATVYREHSRGRIRFTKVGRLTFVRQSEIERYLRSQTDRAA